MSRIPILLRAVDLVNATDVVGVATRVTESISPSGLAPFDDQDLQSGYVVVLADALDEVKEADREHVLALLQQHHDRYPKGKVVLTARNYSSIGKLPGINVFERYELSELDFRQITRMIERRRVDGRLDSERAAETLRRLNDVHGVGLSPMIVSIFMASSDAERTDIPPNVTEVFKKYTEQMLGRWDERKGVAQQYQAPLKDFLLGKVAYRLHSERRFETTLSEIDAILRTELQERGRPADFETLYDEIVMRSGLLHVEGETVTFRHHVFQEFFAGRSIPDTAELGHRTCDEWWRTPIVFHFGEHAENEHGLKYLADEADKMQLVDAAEAAITIGLASQAAFLVKTKPREKLIARVIRTLAQAQDVSIERRAAALGAQVELQPFITFVINARDSVATPLVSQVLKDLLSEEVLEFDEEQQVRERMIFWCILGMIEVGLLADAEVHVKRFKPDDLRLTLGILMSCFYAEHRRVASKAMKKIAARMSSTLTPRVEQLLRKMLKEYKSYLLEYRKGQVVAVEPISEERATE